MRYQAGIQELTVMVLVTVIRAPNSEVEKVAEEEAEAQVGVPKCKKYHRN